MYLFIRYRSLLPRVEVVGPHRRASTCMPKFISTYLLYEIYIHMYTEIVVYVDVHMYPSVDFRNFIVFFAAETLAH